MEEEAPFGARRGFLVGVFCSVGRSVSGRLRLVVGGGEVSSEVGEEGIMAFAEAKRVLYVLLREDMTGEGGKAEVWLGGRRERGRSRATTATARGVYCTRSIASRWLCLPLDASVTCIQTRLWQLPAPSPLGRSPYCRLPIMDFCVVVSAYSYPLGLVSPRQIPPESLASYPSSASAEQQDDLTTISSATPRGRSVCKTVGIHSRRNHALTIHR